MWNWFGFSFAPYLVISVLMHGAAVWLIYLLAKSSSGRSDLAAMAAILFSVNTNWTEVVLWTSGQTISITAIFVLLAMHAIWHKKHKGWMLFLASWTSALALGLLGATLVVYRHLRWKTVGILILVGVFYVWRGSDGTSIETSITWAWKVIVVAGGMLVHTVIGRLLIPFDRLELVRIGIVILLMVYGACKLRDSLMGIWHDVWVRFLLWQIVLYYLVVAAGRAQYGLGIMRAERYGYIGLALFLLLLVRILRKVKLGKWVWIVPMIVCLQIAGLYVRASAYIERPQQLKRLVAELQQKEEQAIEMEAYLPQFVLGDDRLKYRDLVRLIHD